ncbi:hypothetical protein QOZ80_2AG0119230 [Eleusine coracana subsp. coracana]|nr:hypothetical protein QOZ80_2AG0119230 [Eleusine coracana subsp. coracana]
MPPTFGDFRFKDLVATMELQSLASCLAILLVGAFFLAGVCHRRGCHGRKYNLPPGPRPWPVIGNLNHIGTLPHLSLHILAKRYGPFMSLRLGSVPVIVGSSVDAARFFLKTHDTAFLDRARTAVGRYTLYNCSNMSWSPYGPYWRQARKLWQAELFSAKCLMSQEHVRVEEVRAMLRDLWVASSSAGSRNAVTLRDHLLMVSLNVVSRLVQGKKYISEERPDTGTTPKEFRWMIDELFVLMGVLNIGDMIPWLNCLDLQGYIRRMKRVSKMFDGFLEHVLDEHNERRQREGKEFVVLDMVDQLLQLADDQNLEVPIHRDGVKAFTLDLIAGGTETSAVTVEWAMSEILRKPEVLAKATEELDRVVGRSQLVTEADIPNLRYLEAIVKEAMRLHPVAPLLVPRLSREDTSVGGYDIPTSTRVLINVWAIGRDPTVWEAPTEFRPERFLGSNVDVKGQHFCLLPFGSGRRMCPGLPLGLIMVHLTLANLLHGFTWRLPYGTAPEDLSMEEKLGITTPRLVPLKAVAERRLPAHLYAGPSMNE